MSSMGTRTRRALAATAAVLIAVGAAGLGAAPGAEAAAPKNKELRVLQHNIAGGTMFRGSPRALNGINTQIREFKAEVVMLEEICESQVESFKTAHKGWAVVFTPMVMNQRSCRQPGFKSIQQGQMLATKYRLSSIGLLDLGGDVHDYYSDGERRNKAFTLTCANVVVPGYRAEGLRACVTHLRAGRTKTDMSAKAAQAAKIRKNLSPRVWKRGQAVVIAGDLNMRPGDGGMDELYRLTLSGTYTGRGDFYEADQTDKRYFPDSGSVKCGKSACRSGERTVKGGKIDYIFISRNVTHGAPVSGMAEKLHGSDHYLYRALFKVRY